VWFDETGERKPIPYQAAQPYLTTLAACSSRAHIKNDDLPAGRNRLDKSAPAGKNGWRGLSRFEQGKARLMDERSWLAGMKVPGNEFPG
jgi:hypothetical protein